MCTCVLNKNFENIVGAGKIVKFNESKQNLDKGRRFDGFGRIGREKKQ